jgi:ribose/xylose/arabinose/galactoside ABC-type transport system permease subunit
MPRGYPETGPGYEQVMSSPIRILLLGVAVAVFAIVVSALTDLSVGVVMALAAGVAVYLGFVVGDRGAARRDG